MELPNNLHPPAGLGQNPHHSSVSSSVQDTGGLEVTGSTPRSRSDGSVDLHGDPPGQRDEVQTGAAVPALRFCGQLAKWTGNSANCQGDVGISSSIFFEASPGEIAPSRLELCNEGSTAIFYRWEKLDAPSSISHLLSRRKRACFYFDQSSGVILPGVTQQIDLMFKSGTPGLHVESWQLQTHPMLLQGASVQVALMGLAVHEDKTAELRRYLETRLEKTVAEKFCRSLVYKILDGIQTKERSGSLAEFLMGNPGNDRCGERQEIENTDPADHCESTDDQI